MHSSCSLTSNESPWILIARRRGTTATTEPEKMTQISQSMSVPLTSHVMWNPNSSAYLFWIFNGRCQWYQQIDGKITICHHFPIIFPRFLHQPLPSPEAENHRPQGATHGGPGTDVHVKVPQGPVLSRKFPWKAWLIEKNPWRYRKRIGKGWTRIYMELNICWLFFWKKKQYRKTGRLGKLSCRFPFNQFWGKLVTKKCYGKKWPLVALRTGLIQDASKCFKFQIGNVHVWGAAKVCWSCFLWPIQWWIQCRVQ